MLNDTRSGRITTPEFLQGLIDTLTQRGRAVLGIKPDREAGEDRDLALLGEALLSRRGEASGVAIAQSLLAAFERAAEYVYDGQSAPRRRRLRRLRAALTSRRRSDHRQST